VSAIPLDWPIMNTEHGMLVTFGEIVQQHGLLDRLQQVPITQKTRRLAPQAKLIEFLAGIRSGKPVTLSNIEFKLLSCFVRHPNRALTYSDLLQSVWGHTYLKAKSDVSQYVRYLRQKIEAEPVNPVYFQSIRSIGYLFGSRM
jgi:DNA-binding response OmpR family regulator